MRILTNLISPLTLFSVFIGGILAGNQDSKKGSRKNQSEKRLTKATKTKRN